MPWRETSVMEERLRFVARLLEGEGMSEVCREFGILTCHCEFPPGWIRVRPIMNRPQTLDQYRLEFSGFIQGCGLIAPPEFISEIGTLLPIAP
jgi:hypothetical protein